MSPVLIPQRHSPAHRFLDLLGGDADPNTASPLKACHVQGLQGVAPHVLQGSWGQSRGEERGPREPGPGRGRGRGRTVPLSCRSVRISLRTM